MAEVAKRSNRPATAYTFKASTMAPTRSNDHGSVKIIDSRNFPVSEKIAAAIVTVKPGRLRELHWHPNGSEWQFWLKGRLRMTVFNAQETARTTDFNANDVGFVPNMAGHYVENTGDEDLVFLECSLLPNSKTFPLITGCGRFQRRSPQRTPTSARKNLIKSLPPKRFCSSKPPA